MKYSLILASFHWVKSIASFWQEPQNAPFCVGVNSLHRWWHGMGIERENGFFIGELVWLDAEEMLDSAIFHRETQFLRNYFLNRKDVGFLVFIGENELELLLL
jgi:hypothetical protein